MRATTLFSRAALSLGLIVGAAVPVIAESPWTVQVAAPPPKAMPPIDVPAAPPAQPATPRPMPAVDGMSPTTRPDPAAIAVPCATCAQGTCTTCTPPPPPFDGPLCERPKLTGDWLGLRSALRCDGITLDGSVTNFWQGVQSGGKDHNMFYGGRGDLFLNVDGEKAGLWKGFFITLHGETNFGLSTNGADGAILPSNMAMLFPAAAPSTALTGVKFTQALSESFITFFGKINTIDGFTQPLGLGGLTDGFLNGALFFNPVYTRTIPYSTLGAGAAVLKDGQPVLTGMVLDANNTPTVSGFNSFFDNGSVILGMANLPVTLDGLPGHQGFSAVYSTRSYTSIDQSPFLVLSSILLPGVNARSETGSWCLTYQFDQMLVMDRCNPKKGWGFFGSLGITDGNPNPIKWFASGGLGGNSPLAGRSNDTFGLGYFYVGLSDDVRDLNGRVLNVSDEHGVELFYNIAVAPWCHVTPDLQVLRPESNRVDTAFLLGVRAKLDF
jgi:porin